MREQVVSEFFDGDKSDAHDAFQRWRADNPAGFFANCRASGGWMLHRVGCAHPGSTEWEAGQWGSLTRVRKACSNDLRALIEWARQKGQPSLRECSDCKPGSATDLLHVPSVRASRSPQEAQKSPLTLFSWGYWGWGTATQRLVEAVDAVEKSRGYRPPLFVDIRIRRVGKAPGFVGNAFKQTVGPCRYKWLQGLGNLAITHGGRKPQRRDNETPLPFHSTTPGRRRFQRV